MRDYELLCVLPGTLAEDEVKPLVDQISAIVSEEGAEGLKHSDLGKSRLAYPMKHIRYGYFELFHFSAEAEAVAKMKKKFQLLQGVLRTLIQAYDPALREKKNDVLGKMKHAAATKTVAAASETKATEKPAAQKAIATAEATAPTTPKAEEERGKVDMAEIDKKLDEILDSSIQDV